MAQAVNFLPWRARQQRRCLRGWITIFSATLLLIVLLATMLRMHALLENQRLRRVQQAGVTLQAGLAQRQARLLAQQAERQARQQRYKRLQATREWQQTLTRLADTLPAQAWLSELRFEQGTLSLAGYAVSFAALGQLETALNALPGLRMGKPGAASRDAQGRWQFNYALLPDVPHAPQP
ncbi:PilN domain-containing protein [Pseudescherichia vulneris]|uniref:PilN domain-containing protein n=1 Tax=Pseudescherichia vulneris TaxID=566 RepID=UPI0012ABA697|nr:PilN domain-containing protein [Pseudescherichia vulneris]MDU5452254.1 PilN domain-containing protein [Pseudescherichia vulneris]